MRKAGNLRHAFRWLLFDFLPARRRWQALGVVGLMIAGGVAELFTLGAIFPLLAVMADPSTISENGKLSTFFGELGVDPRHLSLNTLGIAFCLIALTAAGARITLAWASQSLVFRIGYDLGVTLYERVLHQPYSFHVANNSSRVLASVNNIKLLLTGMFLPLMQGLSGTVIGLFILSGLIFIHPAIALISFAGFGGIYAVISMITRPRLRRNAGEIAVTNKARVKAVQEGLGGIRDVLIDNSQPVYIRKFARLDKRLRDAQAANALIAVTPRFLVEALGMIFIVALALAINAINGSLSGSLPVLAVLAVGAQRLLPLLQQAYHAWANVMGNQMIFLNVVELLQQPVPERFAQPRSVPALHLSGSLSIDDVSFRYVPDGPDVLKQIDLIIPRGARIGFIGKSGSGKSTLMDLLMGLLQPTAGSVLIDGTRLDESNVVAWQKQVAHVPQHIFLSDGSFTENIAFGMRPRDIDMDRVRDACRKAELEQFIEGLPAKYDTVIGERGVRLSGGQRQRIGIARALYKEASFLVLDEATSALDDITEASIIAAVNRLGREYTVLMIAHRVTTLRECDLICRLEQGRIVQQGSYASVVDRVRPEVGRWRLTAQ